MKNHNLSSIAGFLALLAVGCGNQTIKETPQTSTTKNPVSEIYKGVFLSDTGCCDTLSRPDDPLFASGYCIRIPVISGEHSNLKDLQALIQSDLQKQAEYCSKQPEDKDLFVKTGFWYVVDDSLLSIVVETLTARYLAEAVSEFCVYHYDLKNNRILTTRDLLAAWGISQVPLLSAIAEQVTLPPDHSEPLFRSDWFETIRWNDLNKLKLYRDSLHQLTVIYPLAENGIESTQIIQ